MASYKTAAPSPTLLRHNTSCWAGLNMSVSADASIIDVIGMYRDGRAWQVDRQQAGCLSAAQMLLWPSQLLPSKCGFMWLSLAAIQLPHKGSRKVNKTDHKGTCRLMCMHQNTHTKQNTRPITLISPEHAHTDETRSPSQVHLSACEWMCCCTLDR